MAKSRKVLRIKLPTRKGSNGADWRRLVLKAGVAAKDAAKIEYTREDLLAVDVKIYLTGRQLEKIDVDNTLKHIMDALQGQPGGHGRKLMGDRERVIWNDRQVRQAAIEKCERPAKLKADAGGFLVIRPYSP